MKELISVIIPAHNVEKYIRKCVDSILEQTYKNIEIIIIEDNSNDNTNFICNQYAKKHDNIIVIHENNKSAGKSRNTGINLAKGKYIMFVDADDSIEKQMIELLHQEITSNDASAVFCAYSEERKLEKRRIFEEGKKSCIYDRNEIVNSIIYNTIYVENDKKELPLYAVWAGLYDLDIVKENKIRFLNENQCYSEDSIFNFEFLCKSSKIVIINKALYNYNMDNMNSICSSYNKRLNYLDEWRNYLLKIANKNKIDRETTNLKINKMYLDCTIIRIKQEILIKEKSFGEKKTEIKNILSNEYLKGILKVSTNFEGKSKNKKVMLYMMKYRLIFMIWLLTNLRSKVEL